MPILIVSQMPKWRLIKASMVPVRTRPVGQVLKFL
jgi:hypothetical protein